MSLSTRPGWLRLFAGNTALDANLWLQPNVLLQKFPAPSFTATTHVSLSASGDQAAGLVVLGSDYASVALRRTGDQLSLVRSTVTDAPSGKPAATLSVGVSQSTQSLRVRCVDASCTFEYSPNKQVWRSLGDPFVAKAGRWVGAKIGLFATGTRGYADFDFLRITPP
jgi:beta-xylosidase